MLLRIVNYKINEVDQEDDEDNLPHGAKVLKEILLPWDNMDRIVCKDSYFALVSSSEELWKHGLRSIHGLCFI